MASGEIQYTACKAKFHCFISCSKCTPRDSKGKLQRSSRHSVFRHFSERHVTNTCNIGGKRLCLHQDGEHQQKEKRRAYSRVAIPGWTLMGH